MKKLFAAASIVMLTTVSVASLAYAEKWVQVKKSKDGSPTLFVDQDNITEKDGLRFFILQSIMLRPEMKKEADRRKVAFIKHPVDCSTRSIYPYLKVQVLNGNGKLLKAQDQQLDKVLKTSRSIYELPGGEAVFDVVCAPNAKLKPEESPNVGRKAEEKAE